MSRLLAGLFAVAAAAPLFAKDVKPAPQVWGREPGGLEVTIGLTKEKLTITVMSGDNGAVVTSKYATAADGTVAFEVTNVEEKGTFPGKPKVGLKGSFKWKAEAEKATLSDLTGEGTADAKDVLEGAYKLKK